MSWSEEVAQYIASTDVVDGARPSVMIHDEASNWGGLTTENHLGAVFSANPEAVSNLLISGGRSAGRTNTLQQFLNSYRSENIDETEYEWNLMETKSPSPCKGLIWRTEGFDAETGEAFIDRKVKNEVMNLNRNRDER